MMRRVVAGLALEPHPQRYGASSAGGVSVLEALECCGGVRSRPGGYVAMDAPQCGAWSPNDVFAMFLIFHSLGSCTSNVISFLFGK